MSYAIIGFAVLSIAMFVCAVFPMFAEEGKDGWNDVEH